MPELPDLEVTKDVLNRRIAHCTIEAVELLDPLILRRPTAAIFQNNLVSRTLEKVRRYGKFIIFNFSSRACLIINPMLAGTLTLQLPSDKILGRTGFRLKLSNGFDLRYHDKKRMGKVYLLLGDESTSLVPTFDEQGPDALDSSLTLELFQQRILKFNAMIKHVLLNQRFIAGLGNAYSDDILFAAHIYPFRKRRTLSNDEIALLYQAMLTVLRNAISTISARTGEFPPPKLRDFLQVHGKGGMPCPVCGTKISSIKSGIRIANFCRHCQQ
jgi:formamidopyrimidine-DNA glycosylase